MLLKKLSILIMFACSGLVVSAQTLSFLHVENQDIVNEQGQKVLLRGVGLGNWLLPEGYMWKFGNEGDRPRKIEAIVTAHLGPNKAKEFWTQFRKNYITEADIRRIAELGYNSVRPALNARLFMEETKPYNFVNEGFELLDNLIAWCKKYGLYVIIDMHGAPGGQTGQNIDDSPNDLPELFSKPQNQELLVKLWVKIARRYCNEPTVAAYDLLNEPLPERTGAADQHKDKLMPLYERLIKEIRKVDKKHMFTLEGYNWANNWSIFTKIPDKNTFLQFHYYCWDNPDNLNDISHYVARQHELNVPVWVGETGERNSTIYYATTQYFEKNNIGWSFWPWKKMDTTNTPYSIKSPAGWQAVAEYSRNGRGATAPDAERIFAELLENIKLENCVYYPDVVNAMLRRLPLKLEAENYGHDGYGRSYVVRDTTVRAATYRKREPVRIESVGSGRRTSGQAVTLADGEWTAYAINSPTAQKWHVAVRIRGFGQLRLSVNGQSVTAEATGEWTEMQLPLLDFSAGINELRAEAVRGEVQIDWFNIDRPVTAAAGTPQIFVTAKDTELRLSEIAAPTEWRHYRQPTERDVFVWLDPQNTFQTVIGIGGALTDAAAETFAKLPKAAQQEFLTACFDREKGIGYNFGRINIASCDFSSDTYAYVADNDSLLETFSLAHDEKYKIPFIKAASVTAGGLRLFASPWSPPAWMKDNNDLLHGGRLLDRYRQTWANHFVKFIREYEASGIPIWGITPQNEPMATQKWESCIFTAEDERDFIKGYLGPTLLRSGLRNTRIIAWDHNRDLLYQRASVLLNDPVAARYIWGIGFHWYETWTGSDMQFDNLKLVADVFPDKALVFTEGCAETFNMKNVNNWRLGERYGYSMLNDFNCGTVAWTDWNVLLDEQGGPNHVGNFCFAPLHADTKTGKLLYTNSYYYIGHFSKFIREGAVRIACSANRDKIQTTAFLNPDGQIVLIVLNTSDDRIAFNLCLFGKAVTVESRPHSIMSILL
ncbi:MAG: cellulase family glycosylhydrolase [Bacteroidales bacterium]|nr:cellulase family glycosylhydrolase [Bacteroidales bacterium]